MFLAKSFKVFSMLTLGIHRSMRSGIRERCSMILFRANYAKHVKAKTKGIMSQLKLRLNSKSRFGGEYQFIPFACCISYFACFHSSRNTKISQVHPKAFDFGLTFFRAYNITLNWLDVLYLFHV